MNYEDIKKANESIEVTRLKNEKTGKEVGDYVEVNQRIKAFRMLYPEGFIKTTLLELKDGVCIMEAKVGYYKGSIDCINETQYLSRIGEIVLGTGTAYEKENSTFINKTSYIENCETSAVGRALAMLGIGIDKSVASKEEVENAVNNQEMTKEDAMQYTFGGKKHPGETILEVWEKDANFLQWYLEKEGMDENVKKAIELLTPLTRDSEEQKHRLELINKIIEYHGKNDLENLKEYYHVKEIWQLTTEEMEGIVRDFEDMVQP